MLRLDQLTVEDQQQSAEAQDPAAAAGLALSEPQAKKAQQAKLVPFSSQLKADDWLLDVELKGAEGGLPSGPPPALLLDLNDSGMTFEVLRGTEAEEYTNAAATILPAMPKVMASLLIMAEAFHFNTLPFMLRKACTCSHLSRILIHVSPNYVQFARC